MVQPVPENIDFAKEEDKIFEQWKANRTFEACLKQSEGRPRYTFYDGPPFATGLPHYGHILAGTIKDVVTRWASQSGFYCERRFGWDTHGLPVEYEIDKMLGIRGPEDVAKMGIAAYNAECRKIVMRYAGEWREIITRMGRWIDFDNDYKTMYPTFMESVWWVFRQLYDKQLVYRGVKVMPYSTKCNTPLSNFESGQNYKDAVDPAVVVSFPIIDNEKYAGCSILAWTTTPYTLPSNLALCVKPDGAYVRVKKGEGEDYIVMECRLDFVFKNAKEYQVLEKLTGKQLEGLKYKPIFGYFAEQMKSRAFRVLADDYVTEGSGTGIVHQAPYFGEDDYRVCLANGVITKDGEIVCPVDGSGKFTDIVKEFAGQYVKDADKGIIKLLKEQKRLIVASQIKHSVPFCWRSDTPLIYKAVPSWFVRVEQMSQRLVANCEPTYWVPDFVKEKRFGNWLRDARDWAISRNRYWGTPIPLWISDDGEEIICIGSIEQLEQLSGEKVTDLHRDSIDHIQIPSKQGKGMLKRVSEVFDCWFESGSMPYAQNHYPFEQKDAFEKNFPADFIAEGIDQTRGWFYTLLVISTALFDSAPFKNLIANGLVLAADGQKMSKSKKNYPDPMEVVRKYGADALRLYLINSPVVRAENLRFREEGVRDVLKDCFLPWYNAYRFLVQNVHLYEEKTKKTVKFTYENLLQPKNLMDRWIVSAAQSLISFVKAEMKAYRLYTVMPMLVKFVDNLTNWYVRMNRRRLKGKDDQESWCDVLECLSFVLLSVVQLMAPFTPFLTELMFANLKKLYTDKTEQSVHMAMLPEVHEHLIDRPVEQRVGYMQTIIDIGRIVRDRRTLPIRNPLPELVVICKEQSVLDNVAILEKYVREELNVKKLTLTTEKDKYGIRLVAEPNLKTLGQRFRTKSKEIASVIRAWTEQDIEKFNASPAEQLVANEQLESDDVRVKYGFADNTSKEISERYEAHGEGVFLVLLDTKIDAKMIEEAFANEVINRIQKMRKTAKLVPTDPIAVYYEVDESNELGHAIAANLQKIEQEIDKPFRKYPAPAALPLIIKEKQDIRQLSLELTILSLNDDNHQQEQKN